MIRKLVKGVDVVAFGYIFVAFSISVALFLFTAVMAGIRTIALTARDMLASSSDRWFVIGLAVSVIWCVLRWRELNRP